MQFIIKKSKQKSTRKKNMFRYLQKIMIIIYIFNFVVLTRTVKPRLPCLNHIVWISLWFKKGNVRIALKLISDVIKCDVTDL